MAQRRRAIGLTRGLIDQARNDADVARTGDYFERTTPPTLSGGEWVLSIALVACLLAAGGWLGGLI